jgi:NhaA family Na+:H+ antiporter
VVLGGQGAGGAGQPALFSPIGLGILCGLVLGKPLGISLFSWLAVRLGLAELPTGVGWPQLFSASWLGGIGFTISLFITHAAFADPALQATAKLAILIAALLAAGMGWGLLRLTSPPYDQTTRIEAPPAAT